MISKVRLGLLKCCVRNNQLRVFLFFLCWRTAVSAPRTSVVGQFCTEGHAISGSTLANNFVPAMDALYSNVSANEYGTAVVGQGPDAVYGLGQCFGDLSAVDCRLCFLEVRSILPKCYPKIGGKLYLEGCYGRYGNFSFFDQTVDSQDANVCSPKNFSSSTQSFSEAVKQVISNVSSLALQNQGYAVNSAMVNGVAAYALVQCWQTLNSSLCNSCLSAAASSVYECLPAEEGHALFAGCYIKYSNVLFWNVYPNGSSSGGRKNIIWIVLGTCLGIILVTAGVLLWMKRVLWSKAAPKSFAELYGVEIPLGIRQSKLIFKYGELKKATNNFSDSNKLGQGSFGIVYKAVLADGKEVAVKQLFIHTRQWIDQFFNEVELISQVRHKNLVKLLGCSLDGPESLLVYEYYSNRSLDLFLFGDDETGHLSWQQRVEIIQGVAEGLSYLHEESENRIIHRDIKASNILLDDKFKPRIADLGLARELAEGITHATTGAAGTLGYMAPEYVINGHLTEKADVYSYGILVIEIVTGRRCGGPIGADTSHLLLSKVVQHYKANTIEKIVDSSVYNDGLREEFMRSVGIGLLCTQANPGDRPVMSTVVEMLRSPQSQEVLLALEDPQFLYLEGVESVQEGKNSWLLSHSVELLPTSSTSSYFTGR